MVLFSSSSIAPISLDLVYPNLIPRQLGATRFFAKIVPTSGGGGARPTNPHPPSLHTWCRSSPFRIVSNSGVDDDDDGTPVPFPPLASSPPPRQPQRCIAEKAPRSASPTSPTTTTTTTATLFSVVSSLYNPSTFVIALALLGGMHPRGIHNHNKHNPIIVLPCGSW